MLNWKRIYLMALGLVLLLSMAQAGEAGEDGVVSSQGPIVVLRAGDYDALTFVRPTVGSTGRQGEATATFDVTYDGFTPEAEAAFQYAVDIWASLITTSMTIHVEANWKILPPGTLGSASSGLWANFRGAPYRNTWYPLPLAESIARSNPNAQDPDITANFNSDYPNWYYGTDGNAPEGYFDLVTVVLHELGHGLGFTGSMRYGQQCGSTAGIACWGGPNGWPYIYDLVTEDLTGNSLINTSIYPNYSSQLAAAVTNGDNYADATNANIANGDTRPRLYAPASWSYGSSYSHLNESTYPAGNEHSLMTPLLGMAEAIHDPGQITLCLFQDMGWTAVCNPESTWDGGGSTNDWSDPGNWSRDLVPAGYTNVVFDDTHTGSTTIDAGFPGQLRSLTIESGYAGTINQNTAVTIEGDFAQAGGAYSQAADLTVLGDFNQAAGVYMAGAGALRLVGTNENQSGGSLGFAAGSQTIALAPGSALNDLEVGDGSTPTVVTPASDLDVNGNLIIRAGSLLNGGNQTFNIAGNWLDEGFGFNPETSTVIFDGSNQSASKPVTSLTLLTQDFSDFDEPPPPSCTFLFTAPTGWSNETVGDGNANWLFGDCDLYSPNSSPYTAGYARRWAGSLPGAEIDSWLLSPAVDLIPGVEYELSFSYGVSSASDPSSFSAYYGSDQSSAAMTNQILEVSGATNTAWQNASQSFTVASGGSYHLGIRNADDSYATAHGGLDDIMLTGQQNLTFYNVQVDSTGALTPDTDLVVLNELTVSAGALLDLNAHEATVENVFVNNGTVRQIKDVPAAVTTSFLHITDSTAAIDKYRGLDITPAAAMGNTTVEIRGNQGVCSNQPSDPPLTGRCFDIAPDTAGDATLRFWLAEAERNELDASALVVWHFDGTWQEVGTNPTRSETTLACTSGPFCWVQVEGVSNYSPFVPGNKTSSPTAISLTRQTVEAAAREGGTDILILAFALTGITVWLVIHRHRARKADLD